MCFVLELKLADLLGIGSVASNADVAAVVGNPHQAPPGRPACIPQAVEELRWELSTGAQLQAVVVSNALDQSVLQQTGQASALDVRQLARGT
jgi:hypothetical protein